MKLNSQKKIIGILFAGLLLILPMFIPLMVDYKKKAPINILETPINLPKISTQESVGEIISYGNGVMLQGFYWDSPEDGDWWDLIDSYLPELQEIGFDSIWVPPPYKGASTTGTSSMGYEPFDFYDLGKYNQKGGIETRFGSESELKNLISDANSREIAIVADIVMNHNRGGQLEYNPNLVTYETEFEAKYPGLDVSNNGYKSYTDFMDVASEKFPRNYSSFHPCVEEVFDEGSFLDPIQFPDFCHAKPYVHDEFIKWGQWLKNDIGFDGWRFDNVVNFHPSMVTDWMSEVGGQGVAEYWDGDNNVLESYLDEVNDPNLSLFDFALVYRLREMSMGHGQFDMSRLRWDQGLMGDRPLQSVTFVTNHDTEKGRSDTTNIDLNKHLAYAYILTHEGYPCVFWKDYFNPFYQPQIRTLVKIHNQYAKGTTSVLYADNDLYIAQRNGDPGLVVAINDNEQITKEHSVKTKWSQETLIDLTGQMPNVTTDSEGNALIKASSNGYAIYAPAKSPVGYVPPVPDFGMPTSSLNIPQATIQIDGNFDQAWNLPVWMDNLDDTSGKPEDLSTLYLSVDGDYLYLGFSYFKNFWTSGGNLDFGIAISTHKSEGSNFGPGVHEEIKWNGETLPNYIMYAQSDVDEDPSNTIQNMTLYSYNGAGWGSNGNFTKNMDFSSSPLGFAEFRLPLSALNLQDGSLADLSAMLFSTQEGKLCAADSVPDSDYTFSYGNFEKLRSSWLAMPDSISIEIPESINGSTNGNTNNLNPSIPGYPHLGLLFIMGLGIIAIEINRKYSILIK
ncbi:MAG: alpha-amylase domain-containing protein [Promethearchaeota archaeon]